VAIAATVLHSTRSILATAFRDAAYMLQNDGAPGNKPNYTIKQDEKKAFIKEVSITCLRVSEWKVKTNALVGRFETHLQYTSSLKRENSAMHCISDKTVNWQNIHLEQNLNIGFFVYGDKPTFLNNILHRVHNYYKHVQRILFTVLYKLN
jgi:hypothetical protein